MASPIKKNDYLLTTVFWILVGVFILMICLITIEGFQDFLFTIIPGATLFPLALALMLALSVALIFLTVKRKPKKTLKKFLLLTGLSVAGFAVFTILHNVFYALGIITGHIAVLKYVMEALHVTFFLVGVLVCPLGFLVGLVGSIVQFIKKKGGG